MMVLSLKPSFSFHLPFALYISKVLQLDAHVDIWGNEDIIIGKITHAVRRTPDHLQGELDYNYTSHGWVIRNEVNKPRFLMPCFGIIWKRGHSLLQPVSVITIHKRIYSTYCPYVIVITCLYGQGIKSLVQLSRGLYDTLSHNMFLWSWNATDSTDFSFTGIC